MKSNLKDNLQAICVKIAIEHILIDVRTYAFIMSVHMNVHINIGIGS